MTTDPTGAKYPDGGVEDRIMNLLGEVSQFTMKTVQTLMPTENQRTLYRAMNSLEESGQIKFLFWSGRRKVYTAAGVSKLPAVKTTSGKRTPINEMFKGIANSYDADMQWTRIKRLNHLPIDISRLFLIADLEGQEFKSAYTDAVISLGKHRELLTDLLDMVNTIMSHQSVKGDFDYFKAIFGGKEAPTATEKTDFKVWYSRNFSQKENNEDRAS